MLSVKDNNKLPDFTLEEILDSISKEEFFFVAQPQVELETFKLVGFECLARWEHAEYGEVPPFHFIPLLELERSCHYLTTYLFERMINTISKLDLQSRELTFSLNISANDLLIPDFSDQLISIFSKSKLDPKVITLEVTETVGIFGCQSTSNLKKLHDYGFNLAVDDFWTGFSTLETIRLDVFNEIKVDYSLTSKIIDDKTSMAGINSILQLSSDLQLKCIVEGIETCMQRGILIEAGAKYGQGFLFGRGVKDTILKEWIDNYSGSAENPCSNNCNKFIEGELLSLEGRNHPSWVWDFEENKIVWGNGAAITFWGSSSLSELLERDFSSMSYRAKTRLESYRKRFDIGEEQISSEWDFYPLGDLKKVFCIQIPKINPIKNRMQMLVHAFEGFQSRIPPRKYIDTTDSFPSPFFSVNGSGLIIKMNKHAHVEISMNSDSIFELISNDSFNRIMESCNDGGLLQTFSKCKIKSVGDYLYIRGIAIPDSNTLGQRVYNLIIIPVSDLVSKGLTDISNQP